MAKKESSTGSSSASKTTYGYDELGRLTAATYANGHTVAYSYDAAGNRTLVRAGVGVAVEAPAPPVAAAEVAASPAPAPKSEAPKKGATQKRPAPATKKQATQATKKRAAARPARTGARFCTHCGAPVKEGARFCTSCGERL